MSPSSYQQLQQQQQQQQQQQHLSVNGGEGVGGRRKTSEDVQVVGEASLGSIWIRIFLRTIKHSLNVWKQIFRIERVYV